MRQFEIEKPSKKKIFESLKSDTEHTFNDESLKEITEAVSNFDNSQPSMTVDEAIEWVKAL